MITAQSMLDIKSKNNADRALANRARKTALDILAQAETGGRINDLLHKALARSALTDQERRFTTDLVLGITRLQARLDADLAGCYHGRYGHLQRGVRRLLRLGAYQLRYMEGVPPHAALHTTVELARAIHLARAGGLINAVLRQLSRRPLVMDPPVEISIEDLAAFYSHPPWLVERWLGHWGRQQTDALMAWNNRRPTIWLRPRLDEQRRKQLDRVAAALATQLQPNAQLPQYLSAHPSPAPLLTGPVMEKGLFIVQDPSSGAVVRAVDPRPGEVIIDLCAGPGGKTAALAESVGPQGRVLAYEIDPERVALINDTLNRLNLDNVTLYPGDVRTQPLPKADKILVDAPCSGTGVLARRADLRWRRQPGHLAEMASLQMSLLEHAAKYLRSGGVLIYATCSLEPEENWDLVHAFQQRFPEFSVVPMPEGVPQPWINGQGALQTFPPDHRVDGVYAVRLQVL
ncbi:MAG: 16S rRNA (cytosine(967)-C(5))-methyltransferase RsmB [Candidatus Marinimicrobia bacterium]|nr:16S rRNA (cytosine(967)-C(5))-methyltransferase RsmB [Candidatus Neomarinimicrobiota bacterium]